MNNLTTQQPLGICFEKDLSSLGNYIFLIVIADCYLHKSAHENVSNIWHKKVIIKIIRNL